MLNQLFGKYLVEENLISQDQLNEILGEVAKTKVRLGTIAVAKGYMTEDEADEVNHLQIELDSRFGDIAIERGYLSNSELEELLDQQGKPFMKFVQIVFEKKLFTADEIENYLVNFQKAKGFSDNEIAALKEDDFDAIVPLFAFSAKPYVTELVSLILRNMTRFVTDDFYIGYIKHVKDFEYKSIVGQKTSGGHNIYAAFASVEDEEGIISLASDFSKEKINGISEYVYDTVSEFVNICLGLFVTGISRKGGFADIEPPYIFINQKTSGEGYIVPLYIHGKKTEIFISVDVDDFEIGQNPHKIDNKKKTNLKKQADGEKTVMIADDSMFIRKVLHEIIDETPGYCVICEAVNGQEAVELYKEYNPDVVTMDITMPVMDGVTALKNIMYYDDEAKVVMITSAGQQKKVIDALKIGAYQFCTKPFDKNAILKALEMADK